MDRLADVAPAFVEMAHRIVWATGATVDPNDQPRTRILHPLWEWDGERLSGWIATGPTPVKRADLDHSPHVSLNYWNPEHDTCTADCHATWRLDPESRENVWNQFKNAPAPVGYDPAMIPQWTDPQAPAFGALHLDPYRLRVFPGSVLMGRGGRVLTWSS